MKLKHFALPWALMVALGLLGCGGSNSSPGGGGGGGGNGSWTALAAPFGSGYALTIDSGGNLYAASNGGGGVSRSTDGGHTWSAVNSGLAGKCEIALGLNALGEVLTGDASCTGTNPNPPFSANAYRLISNGQSWTQASPVVRNWIAPLTVNGSNQVLAGSYGQGIWLSSDNGNTYSAAAGNIPATAGIVFSIATADGTHAYAGVEVGGVYQSTDAGHHWTALGVPTGSGAANTRAIGFSPSGEVLVSRQGEGIYCWNGSSWSNCSSGLHGGSAGLVVWDLRLNNAKSRVYAATSNGVFSSADGHSWTAMPGIPVSNSSTGAIDCRGIVFDSSGFGYVITRSSDSGSGSGGLFKTKSAQ